MDDSIIAHQIIEGKFRNDSKSVFNNYSYVYKTTNENLHLYEDHFEGKDSLLSITASGEQVLSALNKGVTDITCYDISCFPNYFLKLRLAAVLGLSLEEYIQFFYDPVDVYHTFDDDMYFGINGYLDKKDKEFWDFIFNFNDGIEIYNSPLFSSESYNPLVIQERNTYLNEEDYLRLREKIQKANITTYTGDISQIPTDKTYDIAYLSNIYQYGAYCDHKNFVKMVLNLPITDEVIAYLYNISLFQAYIKYNTVFDVEELGKDRCGLMVLKKDA